MRLFSAVVGLVVVAGCTEPTREPTPDPKPEVVTRADSLGAARPVTGGNLSVTSAGKVLLADAEFDTLKVFDPAGTKVELTIALPQGAWPTRAVEAGGKYHVLLRGLGELASVPTAGGEVSRLAVCAEPRSLSVSGAQLLVGCAGGEVVTVRDGQVASSQRFDVEWRDVQLVGDQLVGTSFRSAELVRAPLAGGAAVRFRAEPRRLNSVLDSTLHTPQVAWRMVPGAGKTFVVHQLHANSLRLAAPNSQNPGDSSPYGSSTPGPGLPSCNSSVVVTGITTVTETGELFTARTGDVVPVDAALSPDGSQLAVVGASGTGLSIYPTALVAQTTGLDPNTTPCLTPTAGLTGLPLVSVAWVSNTKLVVLESLRSTPMLFDVTTGASRMLGDEADRSSLAHSLFHSPPKGGAALACASCHPEGGEDGHLWMIDDKPRRTQSLAGGVMARSPFHWTGELSSLGSLMADTFVRRMGGAPVDDATITALGTWLDKVPAPRASVVLDASARAAGLSAFDKAECGSCHLGNGLQEGPVADIGTGEAVRSPSLVGLQARAPFLHTAEVPDIRTRVTGTLHPDHGKLSRLDATEKEQLIKYLESL